MRKLGNIEKALNEILVKLAGNIELQKLLLVDATDVENSQFTPLTLQEMLDKNYICVLPQNEVAIKKNDRNCFLAIALSNIDFLQTKNHKVRGVVYIIMNVEHAIINNNEDRGLHIADVLVDLLDNLKLTCAGAIECQSIVRQAYTEFYTGYELEFSFADFTAGEYQL
jgi:hypothetical protein